VLPTWAAIVIALGGSALGALAGGLAAYITLKATALDTAHREREAWRSRRLSAVESFVTEYTTLFQLLDRVRQEDDPENRAAWLREAGDRFDETQRYALRVGLLFGESEVAQGAEDVLRFLRDAGDALDRGDLDAAVASINNANERQEDFLTSAHAELRPS
jgi:uncharacterized membrane protein